MKTIVRRGEEDELVVNTLSDLIDRGIQHNIHFPEEMRLTDTLESGMGITVVPDILKGKPAFVVEGEGDTIGNVLNGMLLCMTRMCTVIGAFTYHEYLDFESYKEEAALYGPMLELFMDYVKGYHAEKLFLGLGEEKIEGDLPYKIAWQVEGTDITSYILPVDADKYKDDRTYMMVPIIDVEGKVRISYGASPTVEEPGSAFKLLIEFSQHQVFMPDYMWAMKKLIIRGVEEIELMQEPNKDARLYASLVYSLLADINKRLVNILVEKDVEEKETNEDNI